MRRYLYSLFLSILPLLISCLNSGDWTFQEDIRTGRVSIVTSPTSFTSASSRLVFNVTYDAALSVGPTASAGLGITGFNTLVTNDLAVNMTIQKYTMTEIEITSKVIGDTICNHLAINYIVVGYNATTFVEVKFGCFLMEALASGTGPRSQFRTDATYLNAHRLNVTVHLSAFWIHNSQGINNYLAATGSIASGSSQIVYTFQTAQNNTVNHVCITSVIFCESCTQTYYTYSGLSFRGKISNNTLPQTVMNPDQRWQRIDRMFFGISSLNLSRAFSRSFDMDTTQYADLDINYASNFGMYEAMMDYFWIARRDCTTGGSNIFQVDTLSCVASCSANANGDNLETDNPYDFCLDDCYYTCQSCDGSLPTNCSTCDTTKFRTPGGTNECFCSDGYVDIGADFRVEQCYQCKYFIPGCAICSSNIICDTCLQGFVLDTDGRCACTSGYLVTGVCTNITGCTSAIDYSGTVFCVACNQTLHYVRTASTHSCQCSSGYTMNSTFVCVSICGDSIKVPTEVCDDGNTKDGDGCSSTCTIQVNYVCFNGSLTSISVCLISDGFTLTTKYVLRILTGNIMRVGIKIEPLYDNLTEVNFKKYLTHNIPSNNYNVTFNEGLIILDFQYNQTIEGGFYNISLSLDPNIFHDTNLTVTIPTSGMNAKLTYDSNYSLNLPLQIVIIILDVLALLTLVISAVLSEKMIGIQCIQVLQSVLFLQAIMPSNPSSLAPLQMLKYSSGYNQIFGIDYARTYPLSFQLSSLGIQKQFFVSLNVMYIILLVVVLAAIIAKIIQQISLEGIKNAVYQDDEQKSIKKYEKWTNIFNFIFERFVFIFGFLIMFLTIFAIMIQASEMQGDSNLISSQFNLLMAIIAVGIVGGLIGLVCVSSIFPSIKLFPIWTKQWYPMVYFLYQSLFIVLLAFIYTQLYILYVMIGLTSSFLIFTIFYQPYFEQKHNILLILNQVVILLAEGVYLYEYLNQTENQTLYLIFAWVLTILMYIVVFTSLYRLISYRTTLEQLKELGNPNPWDEQTKIPQDNYQKLKTARSNNYSKSKSNLKTKETGEIQMKNIQKGNRHKKATKLTSNTKTNKPEDIEDERNFKWNYNQLADNSNTIQKSKLKQDTSVNRIPATDRDQHLDTSRESPQLNRSSIQKKKSLNKNLADDQQGDGITNNNIEDDNYHLKINNEYVNEADSHILSDDDYGSKRKEDLNNDPLALIKKKLRQDFNSKMDKSTIKQI